MLKRINRLSTKGDFSRLFAKGKYTHASEFVLKYFPNNLPQSRFGFVVSTKISKRAVVRNRAKRQMREIVRSILEKLPAGYDIALIAKPAIKDVEFDKLSTSIRLAFTKARLLR